MIKLRDSEFLYLVSIIKSNYGINLESKRHLIEGRLGNMIAEKGYHSFQEYFDAAFQGDSNDEMMFLINKLTTNHTFFMREGEHFKFFAQTVLPQLFNSVRDRDLRIWSAGCSSGEEPYTLALIMQDFFAGEKLKWDKKLLATDICREVLEKAVQGIYEKEDIERIEPVLRNRYFHKMNSDTWQINQDIRKEVIFRIFNLMDDFPFRRKFHVIFCRNVMIYYDQETKRRLIKKFYDMTEKGGYLFIGMSESIRREESQYTYVMPSVYRKE